MIALNDYEIMMIVLQILLVVFTAIGVFCKLNS